MEIEEGRGTWSSLERLKRTGREVKGSHGKSRTRRLAFKAPQTHIHLTSQLGISSDLR